jgi:hypothetical protein
MILWDSYLRFVERARTAPTAGNGEARLREKTGSREVAK